MKKYNNIVIYLFIDPFFIHYVTQNYPICHNYPFSLTNNKLTSSKLNYVFNLKISESGTNFSCLVLTGRLTLDSVRIFRDLSDK